MGLRVGERKEEGVAEAVAWPELVAGRSAFSSERRFRGGGKRYFVRLLCLIRVFKIERVRLKWCYIGLGFRSRLVGLGLTQVHEPVG